MRSTHLLFLFRISRICLRSGRSPSFYLPITRVIKQIVVIVRGISLLPITHKVLSNILLSRLTPYVEEIIGDHQYGFQHKMSTADHTLCSRQILLKKWEYKEAVCQLFVDSRKLMIQLEGMSYIIFALSSVCP